MSHHWSALVTACCLLIGGAAAAQQHQHAAATDELLGTVTFTTSCQPAVAAQFNRAMALVHSFEFGASIRAFNEVIAADSACAMAYWGLALSRWTNPMAPGIRAPALLAAGRAASDAAQRRAAASGVSQRERDYIAAVAKLYENYETVPQQARVAAYTRAMEDVAARYPDDTEAAIFHALALTASASPTDKTYANQLRAGGILEPIWAKHPDHPGLAHYIIHAYDHPPLAERARAAAQRYARIAPSAAHALHMPSHTFTRVGLWEESVESNRRSRDVALQTEAIAEALHAADYLMYAYLQMRRETDAKSVLDTLPAIAARFDVNAITGAAPGAAGVFAIAAIPARYAVERRDWNAATRLTATASPFPWTEGMTYFARALGGVRTGDRALARASIDSLAAIHKRLVQRGEGYWAEQVAIQELVARGWLERVEGRNDRALTVMREAADREDATDKAAVSPGPLAPAREQLGDLLLELGRSRDALAEYRRTLEREPNRYHALDGARRAASASGDSAAARGYDAQLRALTGRER